LDLLTGWVSNSHQFLSDLCHSKKKKKREQGIDVGAGAGVRVRVGGEERRRKEERGKRKEGMCKNEQFGYPYGRSFS